MRKEKAYILFVAPTVYPICGAEGYVNAKLIKALCENDFKLDILSRGKSRHVFYPLETENEIFFSKVNAKYVISVNTGYNLKTIILHVLAFLKTGYLYRGIDWAYIAIQKCEELLRRNQYDYIYTFDFPSEVVGLYMAKKYGLRWVSTWNDPYTLKKYPFPYGKGKMAKLPFLRRKLIRDIGKMSYCNIFPSDRLRDYMLTYMTNMRENSCVICPHINLSYLNRSVKGQSDGILRILHSGNLSWERNPASFLKGLSLFLEKYPNALIHISFLGISNLKNSFFSSLIDKYNLWKYISVVPPVSYLRSLDIISEYDICMLIEAPCQEGIFLPSKVMDYMQCQKPIWAISPSIGILNDMYRKHDISYFSDVRDPQNIMATLEQIANDYANRVFVNMKFDYKKYDEAAIVDTHLKYIVCSR